jgi:hypothetical protein
MYSLGIHLTLNGLHVSVCLPICMYVHTCQFTQTHTRLSLINPLLLLFKALLHGQKDHVFFSRHLIYIQQQERFRAFRLARDI